MTVRSEMYAAYRTIPDALLIVSQDGTIQFANQHAERLFGYELGHLTGLKIEALLPERFRQTHAKSRADFFSDPTVRPMGSGRELMAMRSDGREIPVEIAIGPADHEEQAVAIIRDITENLATRAELGESKERLSGILNSLDSHVALMNQEGEIVAVNQAWNNFARENEAESNNLFRVGADYLDNCRLAAESDPNAKSALVGILSVLDGSNEIFKMEHPCHSPTQHRWFSMTVTPVNKKGGGVVVTHTDVSEKVLARKGLEHTMANLERSREDLRTESEHLLENINRERIIDDIIGRSAAIASTLEKVAQAAKTDATVLLLGETGTGKELLARELHYQSNRKSKPLVKVDCATLPSGLAESELFGHEKGAFTGAHESRIGRFELADKGTIFLDEIGELTIEIQAKLLRVLQERAFQRLGSKRERKVDVRIIAATNRDLRVEMSEGRFRSDLYYRLSVFPIESPPLRYRREDIPLLASFFLTRFTATIGRSINSIEKNSMDALVRYNWPGNVRELQNVIERSAILCSSDILTVQESLDNIESQDRESAGSMTQSLDSVERSTILLALEESDWKVKGEGNAASRLGINPSTLRSRMKRLGILRP